MLGGNNDVIFVGRFDQTAAVDSYLDEAKIALIREETPADEDAAASALLALDWSTSIRTC